MSPDNCRYTYLIILILGFSSKTNSAVSLCTLQIRVYGIYEMPRLYILFIIGSTYAWDFTEPVEKGVGG